MEGKTQGRETAGNGECRKKKTRGTENACGNENAGTENTGNYNA